MSPLASRALLLGACWPGLGQLLLRRTARAALTPLAALVLASLAAEGGARTPWALGGWAVLWVLAEAELFNRLVVTPLRKERADRLLRSGIRYLLRGDAARSAAALGRSLALWRSPAAGLYLAAAERALGKPERARRRLERIALDPRSGPWAWEAGRAKAKEVGA